MNLNTWLYICSQEVRGLYVSKGVRGPCATIMSEEETVCRCRGGGSSQKIFVICQHALDPGLTLHAHVDDQC